MTSKERKMFEDWTDSEKRNSRVPAAPFIELIDKFLNEQEPSVTTGCVMGITENASYTSTSSERLDTFGKEASLMFRLYPEKRNLTTIEFSRQARRIRTLRKQKNLDFDVADRIVTKLGFGWGDTPSLEKIYNEVSFNWIDMVRPTSPGIEQEINTKVKRVYDETGTYTGVKKHFGIGETTARLVVKRALAC